MSRIESISAVTVLVVDMARSVRFYEAIGFERLYGGEDAEFTSYRVGDGYLNLAFRAEGGDVAGWGRTILYVDDVDAIRDIRVERPALLAVPDGDDLCRNQLSRRLSNTAESCTRLTG